MGVSSIPFLEVFEDSIDYSNLKEEERLTSWGDTLLALIPWMGDSFTADGRLCMRDFIILPRISCCEMNFPCLNSPLRA
jgi:hypothetical protein